MISCEVLRFRDFVTKNGRKAPFFVNTSFYRTGTQLKQSDTYYAHAVHATFSEEATLLFRPAHKGIPLCIAASIGMSELYEREVGYVANRKKVKGHGDKEILLGAPIKDNDRIVIVEDVTTAGTSIEEIISIIKAQGNAEVLGLMVDVDRCERDKDKRSALSEISKRHDIKTAAIITMKKIIEYLYRCGADGEVIIDDALMERISACYRKCGAEED